jgi:Glycosyl Hydrolase Family 88/Bacterial Ig domain
LQVQAKSCVSWKVGRFGWTAIAWCFCCCTLGAGPLTAIPDQALTTPGAPLTIQVLANDLGSNQMAILQVTAPNHGTVVINSNSVTANANLSRLFQFAASQLSNSVVQIGNTNAYPRATNPDGTWRTSDASDWIPGFFPGAMWDYYAVSGDTNYLLWAADWTAGIASQEFVTDTDDLGFMINNSFGAGYRLTGDPAYEAVELQAAQSVVAVRYDPVVGCIGDTLSTNTLGVIMDSMMNLELLFRAAALSGDTNLYAMAYNHAQRTMLDFIRPDGGNYHGIIYDTTTGAVVDKSWRAAVSEDSTWARGHAWGTYGFTMAYQQTGDARFLDAARQLAGYYLTNAPPDFVPYWDFQDPDIPNAPRDSSAAAITFSALVQLSQLVTNLQDSANYWQEAQNILGSLGSTNYLAQGTTSSGILLHGTGNFPPGSEVDVSLIYGDYYFIEALMRCRQIYAQTSVTYTPAPGFQGADTFTYEACDSAGNCSTGTVTVTVGSPVQNPSISVSATTQMPAISFLTASGHSYFLQYASGLGASPSWNNLATNIAGSGGLVSVLDTNVASPRFYRVGMSQ